MYTDPYGSMSGLTGGALVATWVFTIAFAILEIAGLWKIFSKAGEAGWKSIIPFYNAYIEFKIAWGNGWYFLLLLIPVVNIIILCIAMYKLALSYGKGVGYTLGLIFLNPFFIIALGFGSAKYIGPSGMPRQN